MLNWPPCAPVIVGAARAPVATPPEFVTTKLTCELLPPEVTLPKSAAFGVTTIVALAMPAPETEPVTMPPGLPETTKEADFGPVLVGAKLMVNEQEALAASVMPLQVSAVFANWAGLEPEGETVRVPLVTPPLFVTVKT